MCLSFSVFAGLVGVIPLVALVLFNFAIMGFPGIRLNIATAMIASVSMGIGIDYTVHFMEAYKREAAFSGYTDNFLFNAYRTSGVAIIADAVSTGLFTPPGMYVTASLNNSCDLVNAMPYFTFMQWLLLYAESAQIEV